MSIFLCFQEDENVPTIAELDLSSTGLRSVPDYVLTECSSLESLRLSDSVTSVKSRGCMRYCRATVDVKFCDVQTRLGKQAG